MSPQHPAHAASAAKAQINARHFIDGAWVEGNPLVMAVWSHAIWLGAAVFDGARAFEGVTPDLDRHCRRAVRSAATLGLRSPMPAERIQEIALDGVARFPKGTPLYIRPFLWSEDGFMAPDPASTRITVSVVESPLPEPTGTAVCLSRFRRPTPETAPTDAKAVCHYAHAGRANGEAKRLGFDDAVMLDAIGNVAELTTANLWIAKDGAAHTPVPNGTFLNGITRQRVIKLLRGAGVVVHERTITFQELREADELWSTGNYAKLLPITRIEDRHLQPGPIYAHARELYWTFAHGG